MNNSTALKKNLISNVALFFLNGIVSFVLPPFLIRKLGVGAYGLIPLSTYFINYASLITIAIDGSLARFLVLDLAKDDKKAANRTFNTAFTTLMILMVVLLPLMIFFSYNIANYISIPANSKSDARVLFIFDSIGFLLSVVASVFNASAYLANRLDLVNRVSVIGTYVRVIFILIMFYLLAKVSLSGYGISIIIASVVSTLYSLYLFKKFTPFIKIRPKLFNKEILSGLLSMGGWLIVLQLGSILFLQIDLIVINKTLGNVPAGKYSALLQWSSMIRTLAISLSGALGPLILNLYAKEQYDKMIDLTKLSNKMLTLFITCLVAVICIVSPALLKVWIGPEFAKMKGLFMLLLLPLPLNLGILPLFSINRAYNKVKVPGLLTCFMGVANLLLGITLVRYTSLGIYGVAVASAIILSLKNIVFMPIYVAINMNISKLTFFNVLGSSLFLTAIAVGLSFFYTDYFTLNNWFKVIAHSAVLGIIFLLLSYLILSKYEKEMVTKIVRSKLR